jgi:hypothetical protein
VSLTRKYLPNDGLLRPPVSEVIEEISAKDAMFAGNFEHYFTVGFSAMRCINVAMHAAQLTEFGSILDMPSGYGRVLRILKAYFPKARLTACDLNGFHVNSCSYWIILIRNQMQDQLCSTLLYQVSLSE